MFGGCRVAQGLDQHASWIDRAWTLQEATLCKDTYALFAWNESLPPRGTVGWLRDHNNAKIERVRQISVGDPDWWAADDVGIMRLDQLLSITPDVNIGTLVMGTDVWNPESSHELQWSVKCLGEYRFPISILAAMIEGLHNPDSKYKDFVIESAWRSIWMRTSTKPQDMVFSAMHLFGAEIEVDYTRSLKSLIFELAKTASSPGWLNLFCHVPTLQGSGLIPMLPAFRLQQAPTYTLEGLTTASSRIIRDDGYCSKYDIIFKDTSESHGHYVCAKLLSIIDKGEPYIYCDGDDERFLSSYGHMTTLIVSSDGVQFQAICRYRGQLGPIMVVVGQRARRTTRASEEMVVKPEYLFIFLRQDVVEDNEIGSCWTGSYGRRKYFLLRRAKPRIYT